MNRVFGVQRVPRPASPVCWLFLRPFSLTGIAVSLLHFPITLLHNPHPSALPLVESSIPFSSYPPIEPPQTIQDLQFSAPPKKLTPRESSRGTASTNNHEGNNGERPTNFPHTTPAHPTIPGHTPVVPKKGFLIGEAHPSIHSRYVVSVHPISTAGEGVRQIDHFRRPLTQGTSRPSRPSSEPRSHVLSVAGVCIKV